MQTEEPITSVGRTETVACAACVGARFMSVGEAETVLGASKEYLYSGLRNGKFPGTSYGRARVILRSFVEEFVAQVETGRRIEFEEFAAEWRNSLEAAS
ncbi:hypothetical protein [Nonomuraea rubra]|uniref:Excisionase family DNA binding protein n=2 Tax=Nonomuraea rubra TaxID=46180 RepID=A0A7X0U5N5_9ACTN|nr:hypothetical protein [Nonomuraea rubra]MBB6556096.1 excisionase family DNA binding protein [Nonomuraea rubra]